MRKEVLFAIIFGIILGAIILYGIQLANKSISGTNKTNTPPLPGSENEVGSSNSPPKSAFQILSPQDHAIITETITILRGTSKPGSTIAVITESDDLLLEASPEGTFSAQINLVSGENKITVTSLDQDKKTDSVSITVIRTDNLPE